MVNLGYALKRDMTLGEPAQKIIGVCLFAMLTAIGAYVRIPLPFTPVPMTLQTFFVLLSGALLGARMGSASQFAYLALGAAGLPVFQGYNYGIAHIFGPTGGYILGFVFAPFVIGSILEKKAHGLSGTFAAMIAGTAVIYVMGLIGLRMVLNVGVKEALALGLYPFLAGECGKITAAAALYRLYKRN